MSNEDKIVVYAADKRLYEYLPISIGSLLNNNPNVKVKLFIEDDDLEICHHPRVEILNIHHFPTYINPQSPNINGPLGFFSLIRLYLSKILLYKRILWIDVDTIITSNIEEIFDLDITYKAAAGVIDENIRNYYPNYNGLYLNSGILLMNLDFIRANKLDDQWLELINTKKLQFADQDAINFICKNLLKPISAEYNCSCVSMIQKVFCKNPKVLHFAGISKLWNDPYYKLIKKYAIDDLKGVKK